MSSKSLFCFIIKSPSLTSSKEPANKPAIPDFLKFFLEEKLLGNKSLIFFQSKRLPKNSLIQIIPSSVVRTGNLGILIR